MKNISKIANEIIALNQNPSTLVINTKNVKQPTKIQQDNFAKEQLKDKRFRNKVPTLVKNDGKEMEVAVQDPHNKAKTDFVTLDNRGKVKK